jgi:hypothetical protein
MNDLLELTVGEMTVLRNAAWPAKNGSFERGNGGKGRRGKKRKEGKVDSLCPSCHGIAIPEFPGFLRLRAQLFTR